MLKMNIETDTLTTNQPQDYTLFNPLEIDADSSNSIEGESDIPNIKKPSKKGANPWGIFVLGSTFLLMFVAAYLFFALEKDFTQFHTDRMDSTWGSAFLMLAMGLLIFKTCFFVYTLYRYFRYKPIASVSDEELPSTTVIVPAYNEGKQVYD